MKRFAIPRVIPAIPLLVALLASVAGGEGNIPIIVDGLPLDAKAIAVKDEVYVPAWILENYAHTKVNWMRRSNLLEIRTSPPDENPLPPPEGSLNVRIGYYLDTEGFVVGRNTRLYLLNVDPKEFKFPDGKTAAQRAHEGAIERVGKTSPDIHDYLVLPPLERFSPKGWRIVAKMPKEEIATLSATVDKYELLYKGLYYDLLTNLVIEKERSINDSSIIDEATKGMKIQNVPVSDAGVADVSLKNGLYFLYARMLYRNRQIVWDIPVAIRGGSATVELSNRNAAIMQ